MERIFSGPDLEKLTPEEGKELDSAFENGGIYYKYLKAKRIENFYCDHPLSKWFPVYQDECVKAQINVISKRTNFITNSNINRYIKFAHNFYHSGAGHKI